MPRLKPWHTRVVRDAAEIAAIVLAGVWALYVFVFQNVVVPAMAPPTPTVTVTMKHVGDDGPLAVVQLTETFRNVGTTPVVYAAWATTVFGMNVIPENASQPASSSATENELEAFYRFSHPVPVFRYAIVTVQGNRASHYGFQLKPGQVVETSREFFVPKSRFRFLQARIAFFYSKDQVQVVPITLAIEPSGLARPRDTGTNSEQADFLGAELDLAAQ
jgi:hypothetical protein